MLQLPLLSWWLDPIVEGPHDLGGLPLFSRGIRHAPCEGGGQAGCWHAAMASNIQKDDFMRLTLRTLLAYLDDVLEPADARELGQKIEESEFASGLVHRIRSVTRKMRLGAPKLAGKGMGLDANTVAEYLDSTLPQDRLPDFEKVCLESDVHLAEVASCHQILTLVLGEPADVDPGLRERIRGLHLRVDGPPPIPEAPAEPPSERRGVVAPTPPPVEHSREDWNEAPELPAVAPVASPPGTSHSSVRLLPVVGTLVVAFLLALVALRAIGPFDSNHLVLGRLLADRKPASAESQPSQTSASKDEQEAPETRLDQQPAPGPAPPTMVAGTSTPPDHADSGPPVQPQDVAGSVEPTLPAGTFPLPPAEGAVEDAAAVPAPLDRSPAARPAAADVNVGGADASAMPIPIPSSDVPKLQPDSGDAATGTTGSDESTEEATAAEPLARSTSELHVLAVHDPATDMWMRLSPNDPLEAGSHLVALPTYRPQIALNQIALNGGIQLTLVGPASVHLLAPDANGVPGLQLEFGRLLAVGDGKPGTALNLQIGDRSSRVVFQDLDSTLALDVQLYLPPGSDPETVVAHRMIQALSPAGRLNWEEEGPQGHKMIEPNQMLLMADTRVGELSSASPLPDWLDPKSIRPIDRDASEQLQKLLDPERPLATSLSEQVSHRLVEVRSLAIRSLSLLSIDDPYAEAFNSKDLKAFWPDLFETLQMTIANGPERAALVRSTLERLRRETGSRLYRLLWGYSPEQLAAGDGEALVGFLASPSMDLRVLAFENLNRIVGKTNLYRPEVDPARQKGPIRNWARDAERGGIRYKIPPIELSEE